MNANCETCGASFSNRGNQKYCTYECRPPIMARTPKKLLKVPDLRNFPAALEDFMSQVRPDKFTTCWLWQGKTQSNNTQPRFSFGGKNYLAYRLAYVARYGAISELTQLRHECKNTLCVRPSHLTPIGRKSRRVGTGRDWKSGLCNEGLHDLSQPNSVLEIVGFSGHPQRTCRLCKNEKARAKTAQKNLENSSN